MIDIDIIKEMTYHLLENGNADALGTALLTPMFSPTEVTNWQLVLTDDAANWSDALVRTLT